MAMLHSSLISAGVMGVLPSTGSFMNLPSPLALLEQVEMGRRREGRGNTGQENWLSRSGPPWR